MEPLLVAIMLGRVEIGLTVMDRPDCVNLNDVRTALELPTGPITGQAECSSLADVGQAVRGAVRLDKGTLTLVISPAKGVMYPIQVRMARERRWKLARRSGGHQAPPTTATPYAALASYGAQITQSTSMGRGNASNSNVAVVTEALYGTVRGNVTIANDDTKAIRGTWTHVGGQHEVNIGDVISAPSALAGRGTLGRGVRLHVGPQVRDRSWERTITGLAPGPNYNAELYINGQLADWQKVTGQQYHFEGVPAGVGSNKVTVKLYGPAGQEVEVEHNLAVSSDALAPGQIAFTASATEPDRPIIGPVQYRGRDRREAHAKTAMGITDRVTASAGWSRIETENTTDDYVTAGVTVAAFGSHTVEATQGRVGHAVRLTGQVDALRYEHVENDKLQSRAISASTLRESRVALSGNVASTWSTLEARRTETSYSTSYSASMRARATYGRTSFAPSVTGSSSGYASTSLTMQRRLDDWTISARVGLSVMPNMEVTGIGMSARNKVWSAGWNYSDQFSAYVERRVERAEGDMAVRIEGDREGGMLRLTLSYGARGQERVRAGATSTGELAVRVFLDMDDNGYFSPGDVPLKDIPVKGFTNKTDVSGWVEQHLSAGARDVRVNEDELPDPRWYAPLASRVVVRPGGRVTAFIPVKYRTL